MILFIKPLREHFKSELCKFLRFQLFRSCIKNWLFERVFSKQRPHSISQSFSALVKGGLHQQEKIVFALHEQSFLFWRQPYHGTFYFWRRLKRFLTDLK